MRRGRICFHMRLEEMGKQYPELEGKGFVKACDL